MVMSVCTSIFTGLVVWLAGAKLGVGGVAVGYLAVLAGGVVWQQRIWQNSRRLWHTTRVI
jgi:hypothetical protein